MVLSFCWHPREVDLGLLRLGILSWTRCTLVVDHLCVLRARHMVRPELDLFLNLGLEAIEVVVLL